MCSFITIAKRSGFGLYIVYVNVLGFLSQVTVSSTCFRSSVYPSTHLMW